MDNFNIDTYTKAKVAIYYYSKLGDITKIDLILNNYRVVPIGLSYAIYIACKNGLVDLVKYFKNYINKFFPTSNSSTFLSDTSVEKMIMPAACFSGNFELIDFLLEEKLPLSVLALNKISKINDCEKRTTMLHWIFDKLVNMDINYETVIINLLKKNDTQNTLYILTNIPIEKVKSIFINIIRFASSKNNCQVVNWLTNRFDLSEYPHTLVICIHHFLLHLNYEYVEKLLTIKNVLLDPSMVHCFSDMLYTQKGVYVYHYIHNKCNLNVDHLDYRILRCCAESGMLQLMKELINDNKVLFNLSIETNEKFRLCLEHCFRSACCYGHVEIAKWLLEFGTNPNTEVDPNDHFSEWENGLVLAAKNDHWTIVEWLLSLNVHREETINEAIYDTLLFSNDITQIDMLLSKTTTVDHRNMYINAAKNNLNTVSTIYQLYKESIDKMDFVADDFKTGDLFLLDVDVYVHLLKNHSNLDFCQANKSIYAKLISKDIDKLVKHIDLVEKYQPPEYSRNNIRGVILESSLSETKNYFLVKNICHCSGFKESLIDWIIVELMDFYQKNFITKTLLESKLTEIMSKYSHYIDRCDFDWDDSHPIESFYIDNYPENKLYREKIENIKLFDFCTGHDLNLDYRELFYCECKTIISAGINSGSISVDYVAELTTELFDDLGIKYLNILSYYLDHFHIKSFPDFYYSTRNLPKIKFLLNYFDIEKFFVDERKFEHADLEVVKFLLEKSRLETNQYRKLTKNIFKYRADCNNSVDIINILLEKTFHSKLVLDTCLKTSIKYNSINFLNYLVDLGAALPKHIAVDKIDTYGFIKKLAWLHDKGYDISTYSNSILTKIANRLNYKRITKLRLLGCDIGDEVILYWFTTSENYDGKINHLHDLIQIANNKLLTVCKEYYNAITNSDTSNNYSAFEKSLDNFNFDDLLFFRFICFFHINWEILRALLEIIKNNYLPVNFFIDDNDNVSFTISSVKSARKI